MSALVLAIEAAEAVRAAKAAPGGSAFEAELVEAQRRQIAELRAALRDAVANGGPIARFRGVLGGET